MDIKNVKRASLKVYSSPTGTFVAGQRCWNVDAKADIALPCATQVGWDPAARQLGCAGVRGCSLVWLCTTFFVVAATAVSLPLAAEPVLNLKGPGLLILTIAQK